MKKFFLSQIISQILFACLAIFSAAIFSKTAEAQGRFTGERVRNVLNALTTTANQPPKPVVVVSLASLDKFRATVKQIEVANQNGGETPSLLSRILAGYENFSRYHLDSSQPTGLVLFADGFRFYPILFSPIRLDERSESYLPANLGTRVAPGKYRLNPQALPALLTPLFGDLYLQERGKWAFIAPESHLALLPADPTPLLIDLDKEHLWAMRVEVANLPRMATTAALAVNEMAAVAQAQSDAERARIRMQNDFLRQIVGQSESIEAVFSYIDATNELVWRVTETLPSQTQRGQISERRQLATSTLGGFFQPDNAVSALCVKSELTTFQRQQLSVIIRNTLGNLLAEENEEETESKTETNDEKLAVNEAVRELTILYYEGLLAAVNSGAIEMAGTFSQATGLIVAYRVRDAAPIRAAIDKLTRDLIVQPNMREVCGVSISSLTPNFSSWLPQLILGDDVVFLLGVSDDLFCLGIGKRDRVEPGLVAAIEQTQNPPQLLGEKFFVYSGYELGLMIASSGNPNRFWRLKRFAAAADPRAVASGTFQRSGNETITTFRMHGKLLPSLNNLRTQSRTARGR